MSPLKPSCPACGAKMHLTSVEPHPDYGNAFEAHGFACRSCGRTQSYTLRRRPSAGRLAEPATARRLQRPR